MAWRIWGNTRDDGREGRLLVGAAEHAKDWAWHHADAVVNCAQYDFEYRLKDMHQHRWLHIQERHWFNGRSWQQRMRRILDFVITHLVAKHAVLLHCWAGKHRSGVFGVLLIALIQRISWTEAENWYFRERPLPDSWDQQRVQGLHVRHGLSAFLEELRSEAFCQEMLEILRRRGVQPKTRLSSAMSSSGVPGKIS